MQLYKDTKIYIFCPGNFHTGGAELLHQLCSQLMCFDIEAYMVYLPMTSDYDAENPVSDFYRKYHVRWTSQIEDNERNILIVYEGITNYLYVTKKIRRVLWWLSVDNYFTSLTGFIKSLSVANYTKKPLPNFFWFRQGDSEVEHWVQSEYARQFVSVNLQSTDSVYMVEDYINQVFLKTSEAVDLNKKKDMVIFNPKKGMEYTQRLIMAAPELQWKPIANMTAGEVQKCLAAAKVYIDFGFHPGKDRLPREAALSGCVVITGVRGSAGNQIDINIPDEFKFDEYRCQPEAIIRKIKAVLADFHRSYEKQEKYRVGIKEEKKKFAQEVADVFGVHEVKQHVAICCEADEYPSMIDWLKQNADDKIPAYIIYIGDNGLRRSPLMFRKYNNFFYRGNDGSELEFISCEDAKFLYNEGRLNGVVFSQSIDKKTMETISSSIGVAR